MALYKSLVIQKERVQKKKSILEAEHCFHKSSRQANCQTQRNLSHGGKVQRWHSGGKRYFHSMESLPSTFKKMVKNIFICFSSSCQPWKKLLHRSNIYTWIQPNSLMYCSFVTIPCPSSHPLEIIPQWNIQPSSWVLF